MEWLSELAQYFFTVADLVGTASGKFISFEMLLIVVGGSLLGISIGMLPGLTATMGVALLTTLTYRMAHDQALMILISLYVGAIYGGSRSAICSIYRVHRQMQRQHWMATH